MKRLSLAQARALAPLAERIKTASAIDNDEQRQAAMQEIKKDLPKLFRRVSDNSGELIQRLEEIIGSALVSGAVESASSR
jgi:molybdopterin converting factor small subunit